METNMRAYCGADCSICEWREKTNCKGCIASKGEMFWGTCDKALCAIDKGLTHCGQCGDVPCGKLQALFDDPEHGDDGERLANLKAWVKEESVE